MTNTPDAAPAVSPATHRLRLAPADLARISLVGAIVALALSTPGFLSKPSLIALINAMSLVGCVGLAMTFITLGGNAMSFSLGATTSVAGIVFMAALGLGLLPAIVVAIIAGVVISAAQGAVIGWLRANPIIVSMAAYALLLGATQIIVGPKVEAPNLAYEVLKQRLLGVPASFWVFAAMAVIGQLVLTYTRFGHELMLVGSNVRAAEAAGLDVGRVTTAAYMLAGAFAAVAGILVASRFGSADMQTARGFEYTAIAAVLVGGTAIGGGKGSLWQTFIGVAVMATINAVTLLRGFSIEIQQLVVGLAVLGVIVFQGIGRRT
jgi:ribose/xylose/arabinose/galactoside ABC-type transport system permease subunit